jgi:hypothetical protein
MRLAFFGYAWNPAMQPDAYMTETIASFVRAGADVDFYLGSQLSKELGIFGMNEQVSVETLTQFIAAQGYDAAIAFNNSMLIPEVVSAVGGRVVTVIVDEPEHLFDYPRAGPYAAFGQDIEVVAMSSRLERRLVEKIDGIEKRLHFMLPATHVDLEVRSAKATYPISWVASYVGDRNLDDYLQLAMQNPEFHALTIKCLSVLERHGNLMTIKVENRRDLFLIKALPWSFEFFESQMQNILTNRRRVEVVERLSPRGLALFGGSNWQKLLTYNAAVLAALQPGPGVTTHADLRRIYNASKISINLPQAHVSQDAVQYRVIDVMASNALMITQRSPNSDLYRVFGKDCPIPTYSTLEELEQLCAHYLANEKERRAIVEQCNSLLATGFTFAERAVELLRIAGLDAPANAPEGQLRRVDLKVFHT